MTLEDIMPAWVGWLGPTITIVLVALWIMLIPGVVLWNVRRRLDTDLHWTERAELATEGRTAIALGLAVWPVLAITFPRIFNGPFSRLPAGGTGAIACGFGVVAILWVSWRFVGRDLNQPLPGFGSYLWLVIRKWLPLGALFAVGLIAPGRLTSLWMIPWTALAVLTLYGLGYLAEYFVATGVATRADPRVVDAVARAAVRSGSETPRTVVLESHAVNAAALPRRNLIIMTQRIVDLLDDAEIEAVALHEIAHLREKRSVTRRRTFSTLLFLPLLGIRPLLGSGIGFLAAAVLLVALLRKRFAVMSASEEARADHEAVELAHESHVFGEALLKVHRAGLMPAHLKRDPHGPLYDRLVLAGVTPDFEKVESKRKMRVLVSSFVVAMLLMMAAVLFPAFVFDIWDGERGSHVALAYGWRTEEVLGYTGYVEADAGEFDRAVLYLEEAIARGDRFSQANLAWSYASMGRCDDARDVHVDMLTDGADPGDTASAGRWVAYCDGRN